MELLNSYNTIKAGKSYIVYVSNLHPEGDVMTFQVDSGAGVTLLGLDSFCDVTDSDRYECLESIIQEEIVAGDFEIKAGVGATVTREKIKMYPCKFDGASISGTTPMTLYFHIYLGNINMPLLGFDYIDDCAYHHTIGNDMVVTAVAKDAGKRFYPDKVLDFNRILQEYKKLF